MQLIIDTKDIVRIKMSTLEEQQDNQVSALIGDIKKDIHNNVNDDLNGKEVDTSATTDVVNMKEGEIDNAEPGVVKSELQLNGSGEEDIITNGAPETPNNNKENDAPKDTETVEKLENNIDENTVNSINSTIEINKNQVIKENEDKTDATSTSNETVKGDVVNTEIDNKLANSEQCKAPSIQPSDNVTANSEKSIILNDKTAENTEQPSIQPSDDITGNSDKSTILNDKTVENNEQSSVKVVLDSTNNMEISAAEHTEHNSSQSSENDRNSITPEVNQAEGSKEDDEKKIDTSQMETDVNESNKNSSKDEVDKVTVLESHGKLELPAENVGVQNEIISNISKDVVDKEKTPADDKKESLNAGQEEYEINDLKMSETQGDDADKGDTEHTVKKETIVDTLVGNVIIDEQIICKKETEIIIKKETASDTEPKEKYNASDKIIDSTAIKSEPISDASTENEMIVDVPQNLPNSESGDLCNNLSDESNDKVTVKTEVHMNSGDNDEKTKAVLENSVIENLKDIDCISVSSMEVDDVEIVPTENVKTEIIKSQDAMDVSVTSTNDEDNVIEILDQDTAEPKDEKKSETMTEKLEQNIENNRINKKEIELASDIKKENPEEKNKVDISDEDDIKIIEETETKPQTPKKEEPTPVIEDKQLPVVCKLSNTLDILSDEESEPPTKVSEVEEKKTEPQEKQCINIDDDDDIMLIEDEDTKETPTESAKPGNEEPQKSSEKVNDENGEKEANQNISDKDSTLEINEKDSIESPKLSEKEASPAKETPTEPNKPLLPMNFLKSAKKNLAEMTRDELEEFCILKIVESIIDRSSLSDIKSKMKILEQNMEEYKKKGMLLSKQNRDLQVVLKSVQEEQKNNPNPSIIPLKITRSVGMQVLMLDNKGPKKKPPQNVNIAPKPITRNMPQHQKNQKSASNNQNIPVPRLIPASPAKSIPNSPVTTVAKPQTPNGIRNTISPAQKSAEKRPLTRQTASSSNMTVDLTDDEPPAKTAKNTPVPPVRLVPSQNLMAAPIRGQMQANNPRKVFIPINGQGPNIVRGQTMMLKSMPQAMGPRQRLPIPRMTSNTVRMSKITVNRHPAPLPDVMKQYQPPTWKALPPAPDLKLSKVENGIVISWKIEGYQEDSYEKIASYQLYAYQETSTPPSTTSWKKIGDVKALPLPMACTLTQFMAGFKYYFAVRAVDVKSRLGPFSLPGSILLLNKM